jgi:hypothetical protein
MSTLILCVCLFGIIVNFNLQAVHSSSGETFECYIHSNEYKNEYLYVADENLLNMNSRFQNSRDQTKVFVYPIEYIDNLDLFKWDIKKIDPDKNIYLIQNQNEYLCSTNSHLDYFQMRRRVNMFRLSEDLNDIENNNKCLWRLEKLDQNDSDSKLYRVWNFQFGEPLYAAIKNDLNDTRNLYTWYKSHESNMFVWQFDCLDN